MRKTLNKSKLTRTQTSYIRSHTANIILNGKKIERFFFKIWNKARIHSLATVIQHSTGIPTQSNQAIEINKGIEIRKKEVQLSLLMTWSYM